MTVDTIPAPPTPAPAPPPAPATLKNAEQDPEDDSNYGLLMFMCFTTAVFAISLAVCVLALAPSWWMLAVVFATDITITSLVFQVVLHAFVTSGTTDPLHIS